jgi:hypothetical protein
VSPVVCVFARETSGPLTSLVKKIDDEIAKNGALKSFVVVLTDDEDKAASKLKDLAARRGIKNVPLTVVDDPGGPPQYSIAKDADVTVMMWKGAKVRVNRAYKTGDLTEDDVKTIVADVPKLLND